MPALSSLTEFSAAYLFLILGIVFMVLALIFKKGYLFLLAMAGWAFCGFYIFTVADGNATIIMFGTFCMLAALTNIILMVALRPKPEPPSPPKTKQEMDAEYMNELRRRRYGGRIGYDNDGNRNNTGGW